MAAAEDIRDLRKQILDLSITVAGGLEQFNQIAKQQQKLLDKLTKVTLDGNGSDSLLTEVAVIKERLERGAKTFAEIKTKQNKIEAKVNKKSSEETKGKWQLRIAIATGILGLATAAAVALLK